MGTRDPLEIEAEERALERLELARWGGRTTCPYCSSDFVGHLPGQGNSGVRWQCWSCNRTFSALVGTMFDGTRIPLHRWFRCIALVVGAKKPAPSEEVARHLNIRPSVVSSMMRQIRAAMAEPAQAALLGDILAAKAGAVERGKVKRRPIATDATS